MRKVARGEKVERNLKLYEAILTLENVDEAIRFFDDLCSVTEIRAIEQRFQVAKLLNEGHIYNTILEETGASSATISRVNRSLQYGAGGYDIVFKRVKGI
jgi:TrpR-related protein YerC/YecD